LKTLLLLLCLAPALAAAELIPVHLVKVEDSDTVVVRLGDEEVRVQLLGIDAPEADANPKLEVDMRRTGLTADQLLPLGRAASDHLHALVQPGETLILSADPTARDRYGRLPGELFTRDGRSLNITLVADGYARVLDKGVPASLQQRLKRVWQAAQRNRVGLWALEPKTFRAWAGVTGPTLLQ